MSVEKIPSCDSAQVTELVKHFVREAEQVSDVGAELSFILPSSSTSSFPALFDSMEGMVLVQHNYTVTCGTIQCGSVSTRAITLPVMKGFKSNYDGLCG